MNITKELQEISLLKKENLEYLKKSDLPLVLLGAAEFGKVMKYCLDTKRIKIDFVAVDKEYWQPNMKLGEFDVLSLEDVLANNSKLNIIVAFCSEKHIEKMTQLNNLPNVQKCLFICTYMPYHFDFDFVNQHSNILADLYYRLADDFSRQIMLEFMRAQNSSDPNKLMQLNIVNEHQYFPDFLPIFDNEIFVDCGAYDGGTVKDFVDFCEGIYDKIYSFEPIPSQYENTLENIEKCGIQKIEVIRKGVWDCEAILNFTICGYNGMSSRVSKEGAIPVKLVPIDEIIPENEKVTFIKMDIECAELQALKGAQKQIKVNKPKLAICVYHRKEDLITIPQYILSLNPDYKLYLRHYGPFCTELILYAI
jgi:FkbM family methyltransferase